MDMIDIDRSLETASKAMLVRVWRHKIVFVLIAVLVGAPALLGLLLVRPTYEGTTLLVSGQASLAQGPEQPRNPTVTPEALSRIAESEEVVSAAIQKVGLDKVAAGPPGHPESIFQRIRHTLFPSRVPPSRALSPLEAELPRIKLGLTVHTETNSEVIRISYRNRDPIVAADFANAVAQAFVDRQILLYSRPGAVDFFLREQRRFEDLARAEADRLQQFETKTGFYSAADQKQLWLKRLNDLDAAQALTNGLITQKTAEQVALAESLHKLAPVARSPYVSALVDNLSGGRTGDSQGSVGALLGQTADPPQLLIKVYQDSMVTLFQTNADLAGARSLEKQQRAEIDAVRADLDRLTDNEQEFDRLTRAVAQATYNADVFAKRMVEEQINAELSAARFSSLKVIQKATVPLRPVSPNYPVATIAILLASLLAGVAAALLRSRLA